MTFQEFQQRYTYNTTSDRLGEGGFGKVFKAYDTYLDRWVAIKIAPVLPNLESVRLKKEVELISKLPAHPNVARYEECYTYSSFDGEYDFGILQYYEEGNLLDLLKKGNLSQEQKYNMLKQILSGLDFLHKNAIIHRDLKPQNILIVKRGNDYIPKITDFGISKKLDVNKSSVFSNSIAGAGTLAYSSPEQLGDRTIRKNTDLWSFGIIAYQVLTGELPFTTGVHGNTSEAGRQELFSQINSGKLPEKINMVEEPWQKLIKGCLVSDGERRVKDCVECREVLSGEEDKTNETKIDMVRVSLPSDANIEDKPTLIENKSEKHKEEIENIDVGQKHRTYKKFIIGGIIGLIGIILLIFAIIPSNKNIFSKYDEYSGPICNNDNNPIWLVKLNGKLGYIDNKGKEIIPPIFDDASPDCSAGLFYITSNGKWGAIDKNGDSLASCLYEDIEELKAYIQSRNDSINTDTNVTNRIADNVNGQTKKEESKANILSTAKAYPTKEELIKDAARIFKNIPNMTQAQYVSLFSPIQKHVQKFFESGNYIEVIKDDYDRYGKNAPVHYRFDLRNMSFENAQYSHVTEKNGITFYRGRFDIHGVTEIGNDSIQGSLHTIDIMYIEYQNKYYLVRFYKPFKIK